jgi:hypothetical protein
MTEVVLELQVSRADDFWSSQLEMPVALVTFKLHARRATGSLSHTHTHTHTQLES